MKNSHSYVIVLCIALTVLHSLCYAITSEQIESWLNRANVQYIDEGIPLCEEICSYGEPAIVGICSYLKPYGADQNAQLLVRMLLNYVATQPEETQITFAKAICSALEKTNEPNIKAFLITELQLLPTSASVDCLSKYLSDKNLCDFTVRTLQSIGTPKAYQLLLQHLHKSEGICQQSIISALGESNLTEAIPELEKLLDSSNATDTTKMLILQSLAKLETDSQKFYHKILSALNSLPSSHSTQLWTILLSQIRHSINALGYSQHHEAVLEQIWQKSKENNLTQIQCALLHILADTNSPYVLAKIKEEIYNPNIDVRMVALSYLSKQHTEESNKILKEALQKSSKTDVYPILEVVSRTGNKSYFDAVLPWVSCDDMKIRIKSMQTLIRLDAEKAIPTLIQRLAQANQRDELTALRDMLLQTPPQPTVNALGNVLKTLQPEQTPIAIEILSERRAKEYFKPVFALTKHKNVNIRNSALNALGYLGRDKDVPKLVKLMLNSTPEQQEFYRDAIVKILKETDIEHRCDLIIKAIQKAKKEQYPILLSILAKLSDEDSLNFVMNWLNLSHQAVEHQAKIESAIEALNNWQTPDPSSCILDILRSQPNTPYRERLWKTFVRLLSLPGLADDEKTWLLAQAIDITPEYANDIFNSLSNITTVDSLSLIVKYLDDPRYSSASYSALTRLFLTDKDITGLIGKDVIPYLEKLKATVTDENQRQKINKIIQQCQSAPNLMVVYPDDHLFAPLFNGKDLSGWTGYTRGYQVRYGKLVCLPTCHLNLFTEKPYKDFILRFEFKLTHGANNGIGIRVPLMKHAAYDGLEIQIYDDTSPEARNLKPYQLHGSIYGVLPPAVRAPLKKCGEWNHEEISVIGSKITVKVNGVVILEADLNELANKPTPDGKNHPGLQNTEGHIALLGHGSHVEFRNLRIREL